MLRSNAARARDNDRATTHLQRLGVNPATINRLRAWADEDAMTLRDFVGYVLSNYYPAQDDFAVDGDD